MVLVLVSVSLGWVVLIVRASTISSLVMFLFLEKNFALSVDELVLVLSLLTLRTPLQMRASLMLVPFFINFAIVLGLFIFSSYIRSRTKFSIHKLTCSFSGMFKEH